MIVCRLSHHFRRRWAARVGWDPCLETVNRLLEEAVRVRGCVKLYRRVRPAGPNRPAKYAPLKLLAEYWHNRLGVILRVDEAAKTAVTVIPIEHNPGLADEEAGNGKNRQKTDRSDPHRQVTARNER